MRTVAYTVGTIFAVFVALLIIGTAVPPKPKTKYQQCLETARHLRSDLDTAMFTNNFCERLPVEPGDYR